MKTLIVVLSILISGALLAVSTFVGNKYQVSSAYVFLGVIVFLGMIAMVLYRSTDKTLIDMQSNQLLVIGRNLALIGGSGITLLLVAYYIFTGTLP